MRAPAGKADFGRGETRHDLVEAPSRSDDVPRLATLNVRLEDGAVAMKVVVRGEERSDPNVLDPELAAQGDDVFELIEAFFGDVLETRNGGEDERAHLDEITCGKEAGEQVAEERTQ
jgi:hypothetical protein